MKLTKLGKVVFGTIGTMIVGGMILVGCNDDNEKTKEKAEDMQPEELVVETFKDDEVEVPNYADFSEHELAKEIHGMTHQKVKASEKWHYSQITEQKVNAVYDEIKNRNFEDPELKEILLQIEPWLNGNFDNVVEVHNDVWNWQGGTIGKATGKLSPEEEKEFIIEHYK